MRLLVTFIFLICPWKAWATELVAEIISYQGDCRIRRSGTTSWKKIGGNRKLKLYEGDRLFSGEHATIKIQYPAYPNARVILSEKTIFEITPEIPINTQSTRELAGIDSDAMIPMLMHPAVRSVLREKIPADDTASLDLIDLRKYRPRSRNGIVLELDVQETHNKFPRGTIHFHPSKYPASMSIQVETANLPMKLYAQLWRIHNGKSLSWSGNSLQNSGQFSIPVQQPGLYVLFAQNDNGTVKSIPVVIDAQDTKRAPQMSPILYLGDSMVFP